MYLIILMVGVYLIHLDTIDRAAAEELRLFVGQSEKLNLSSGERRERS